MLLAEPSDHQGLDCCQCLARRQDLPNSPTLQLTASYAQGLAKSTCAAARPPFMQQRRLGTCNISHVAATEVNTEPRRNPRDRTRCFCVAKQLCSCRCAHASRSGMTR